LGGAVKADSENEKGASRKIPDRSGFRLAPSVLQPESVATYVRSTCRMEKRQSLPPSVGRPDRGPLSRDVLPQTVLLA